MEDNQFFVSVRADCEATAHAVKNPALGERSVRGLLDVLKREGLKGTLYVIPTDLEASAGLYREAGAQGCEIGLHVHPADLGAEEFLGVLGPDGQRAVLAQARDRFAAAMGRAPESLCIGYHSANDYTFPLLVELGFRHGTNSTPTRNLPECASVWAGAPLDAHYAHPWNRLLPGWLDFVELPSTLDPDSRMWGGKHPQDLRVELVDAKNHWYTIAKAVDRQLREATPVKRIEISTHNIFDFSDPRDFRRETLEKMIAHMKRILSDRGCTLIPATAETTAAAFRAACPLPAPGAGRLKLDTRGRA